MGNQFSRLFNRQNTDNNFDSRFGDGSYRKFEYHYSTLPAQFYKPGYVRTMDIIPTKNLSHSGFKFNDTLSRKKINVPKLMKSSLDSQQSTSVSNSMSKGRAEEFRKNFVQGLWSNSHQLHIKDIGVNTSNSNLDCVDADSDASDERLGTFEKNSKSLRSFNLRNHAPAFNSYFSYTCTSCGNERVKAADPTPCKSTEHTQQDQTDDSNKLNCSPKEAILETHQGVIVSNESHTSGFSSGNQLISDDSGRSISPPDDEQQRINTKINTITNQHQLNNNILNRTSSIGFHSDESAEPTAPTLVREEVSISVVYTNPNKPTERKHETSNMQAKSLSALKSHRRNGGLRSKHRTKSQQNVNEDSKVNKRFSSSNESVDRISVYDNIDVTPTSVDARESLAVPCLKVADVFDSNAKLNQKQHKIKAVVAIDFGTTNCGYAYAFTDPLNGDKTVHINKMQEGGDPGISSEKCPTALLLTPIGEFHSFGYVARDCYHDLDMQQAKKFLYFEKFKMKLQALDLHINTKIQAANGVEFPLLEVLASTLRHFKRLAHSELSDQSPDPKFGIDSSEIQWVVTVPAIWKQKAKQVMREAAYMAGLISPKRPKQLVIALEPEAAALYCRQIQHNLTVNDCVDFSIHRKYNYSVQNDPVQALDSFDAANSASGDNNMPLLEAGSGYIIVDCGGGTVDITVHQVAEDNRSLKEIFKASGGSYGSSGVDAAFESLLSDIFTCEFMFSFRQRYPAAFVDLFIAFESRKRYVNPYKLNALNIALPYAFMEFHKKCRGHSVECAVKKYSSKQISWTSQGMLRLSAQVLQSLFASTLNGIAKCVSKVLTNVGSCQVEYLFLVGGFSASSLLQHHIRKEFGSKLKVIAPPDTSVAVLKGAVLFGLFPNLITVRRSTMTYGIGVLNKFNPEQHPISKKVCQEGMEWCTDIFDRFVTAGQSVASGDCVVRCYCPAADSQNEIIIQIYCTEAENPKFVNDSGVRRCGVLRLQLPKLFISDLSGEKQRREIETFICFGGTEIKVQARDKASGHKVNCGIDFVTNS